MMGMLDGIVGGVVGAEMATVVARLVEKHGGVQGIARQFEAQGFGPTVRSWISTGDNDPISPDDMHRVLGTDTVNDLAAKAGMSPQDLAAKLAQVLPTAVDRMTPTGVMPTGVYPVPPR